LDNKHRAMLFFGVMIFVMIGFISYITSAAYDAAGAAVSLQQSQINQSKVCANNCDSLAEAGQLSCDWIECHQRCYIGSDYPYCTEQS